MFIYVIVYRYTFIVYKHTFYYIRMKYFASRMNNLILVILIWLTILESRLLLLKWPKLFSEMQFEST